MICLMRYEGELLVENEWKGMLALFTLQHVACER